MRTTVKTICFLILLFVAGYDVIAAFKIRDLYAAVLNSCLFFILITATALSFGD